MTGKPASSIHFDHEAETFDTSQRASQPATTTGDPLSTLADWKGEGSRRVPGEVSTAGATGRSDKERSEPRTHESARASGASSGVASETQLSFHQ